MIHLYYYERFLSVSRMRLRCESIVWRDKNGGDDTLVERVVDELVVHSCPVLRSPEGGGDVVQRQEELCLRPWLCRVLGVNPPLM